MSFAIDFYGLPASVRSSVVIPLLIGPPGASADVTDGSITNAKLANVATATFKGRTTAGTGAPEDLTATQATALLNVADGSLKGLMSAADFTKLAGVATGATANTGTVTTVSVTTANGISGSITNASTTPAITLTLGAITPSQIALTGNISAPAWTTSGLRLRGVAATLTDTTSSGTVATATTDALGGNTIAASSATTFTNYSTLTLDIPTAGTNVTLTNRWALSLLGGLRSTGQSLTGSQAQSLVDLSATWNTSGTPTAFKINVTDTASNAASLLIDLQKGGISQFNIDKNGALTLGPATGTIKGATSLDFFVAGTRRFSVSSSVATFYGNSTGSVFLGNNSPLSFGADGTTLDTYIYRDGAANTLAQRNGTNAQTLRVYNTYTDASNYERLRIGHSSNTAFIGPENAGTGTARNFVLGAAGGTGAAIGLNSDGAFNFFNSYAGQNPWNIQNNGSGGHFVPGATNTRDIGTSSLTIRNMYMGSWLRMAATTVASLPAAATAGAGARMFVTDALTPAFGSAVTGGGAVIVPVYSTGSAWNVG